MSKAFTHGGAENAIIMMEWLLGLSPSKQNDFWDFCDGSYELRNMLLELGERFDDVWETLVHVHKVLEHPTITFTHDYLFVYDLTECVYQGVEYFKRPLLDWTQKELLDFILKKYPEIKR
jgi:hypothetical protein